MPRKRTNPVGRPRRNNQNVTRRGSSPSLDKVVNEANVANLGNLISAQSESSAITADVIAVNQETTLNLEPGEYEVQEIVGKYCRKGTVFYHVKWKGYPE